MRTIMVRLTSDRSPNSCWLQLRAKRWRLTFAATTR
jgi:hypothetical protein